MTRVFLISPEPFYTDVIPEMVQRDIIPVLVCASERDCLSERIKSLLPEAEIVSSFEMMGGNAGGLNADNLPPPSTDLLKQLAPNEAMALQMLDRCNYDNLPVAELRSFYLRYLSLWVALIERHQPDVVIFHGTPHMGYDYVLYLLCRALGVRTLIVDRTYLDERLFFRQTLYDCPQVPDNDSIVVDEGWAPDNTNLIGAHYDTLNRRLNDLRDISRRLSWPYLFINLLRQLPRREAWARQASSVHGLSQRRPRLIQLMFEETFDHRAAKKAFRYYRRIASEPDLTQLFVYYPLHFEPERTTVPEGELFTNQPDVAFRIAAALPQGWRLLIKEHPRQFRRGLLWSKARSIEFYRRLALHPQIQLVPLETSSQSLIKNCRAVTTITGTAGWEAVQAGKPAIVFGHPWYRHCPGTYKIDDEEDVQNALAVIAAGRHQFDKEDAHRFSAKLATHVTFRGCFSDKILQLSKMTPQQNGQNFGAAIAATLERSCLSNQHLHESQAAGSSPGNCGPL